MGSLSRWGRAAFVLGFLGATLGASLDAMHVATRTTSYPDPVVFGLAWWVFPLFASAGIAIGLGRPVWERVLRARTPRPTLANATLGIALFVAAYLASGLIRWPWPARSALLAGIFAGTWLALDRTKLGIALAFGTAVAGTLFEMNLVRLGLFSYVAPDVGGVAAWLPWLYTTSAIGVGQLGKRLVDEP